MKVACWLVGGVGVLLLALTPAAGQDDAAAVDGAAAKKAADAKAKPAPPPAITDPVIQTIVDSNPQTPHDLVRVIDLLVRADHAVHAVPLVKKLLGAKLTDQAAAELVAEFGSAVFIRMGSTEQLAPEGSQVASKILTAADRYFRDAKRLDALIRSLSSADEAARQNAMRGLLAAGVDGVKAMLSALADPAREAEHPAIRQLLSRISGAYGPLLGALESTDPEFKAHVIEVLGRLGRREAVIYLLGPYTLPESGERIREAAAAALQRLVGALPSKADAKYLLRRHGLEYFSGERPLTSDSEGRVELWHWDAKARQPVAALYPARQASLMVAARLLGDLYALAPADAEVRRLYFVSSLEVAAYQASLKQPGNDTKAIENLAAQRPPVVADVLDFAMETGHFRAGTLAAASLGSSKDPSALVGENGFPSPLVAAVRHGDPLLRFTALEAVMQLDPQGPFAGSSYIPEALGYFAASKGTRRGLVLHPRLEAAQRMAGMLGELGMESDTVTNGHDLIKLAGKSPDYELILISAAVDRPGITELLQWLRDDPRTMALPIAVILEAISGERIEPPQPPEEQNPRAFAYPRPFETAAMKKLLSQAAADPAGGLAAPSQRLRQGELAMGWLAKLSKLQDVFSLRAYESVAVAAIYRPHLVASAAEMLSNLGTASSQQALVDAASRPTLPLATRQIAAAAFGSSITRFGIRLTTDEILRQYDLYNQSEVLDKDTQNVLSSILDAIEAKGLSGTMNAER